VLYNATVYNNEAGEIQGGFAAARDIDPEEVMVKRSPWGGLGLLSIKARTELSGGIFEIESVKGKGTTVRASWPL
jgi:signal transduction histidine kinase